MLKIFKIFEGDLFIDIFPKNIAEITKIFSWSGKKSGGHNDITNSWRQCDHEIQQKFSTFSIRILSAQFFFVIQKEKSLLKLLNLKFLPVRPQIVITMNYEFRLTFHPFISFIIITAAAASLVYQYSWKIVFPR